jgi:hypothetical protein
MFLPVLECCCTPQPTPHITQSGKVDNATKLSRPRLDFYTPRTSHLRLCNKAYIRGYTGAKEYLESNNVGIIKA